MKIGINFVVCILMLAFLNVSCSESTSTLEITADKNASISINGKQLQVRDGILTYKAKTIAVPENARLKIAHTDTLVHIYINGKLVLKEP